MVIIKLVPLEHMIWYIQHQWVQILKKNGEHVIIMEQTNGKLTMTNNRFVVMANRPPDLSLIKEQFHDLFEGRYIIMVDFGRVTIANLENDKQQNYYHEYEINMQHQNYITWVQSIIPHWKTSNNRKKKQTSLL